MIVINFNEKKIKTQFYEKFGNFELDFDSKTQKNIDK